MKLISYEIHFLDFVWDLSLYNSSPRSCRAPCWSSSCPGGAGTSGPACCSPCSCGTAPASPRPARRCRPSTGSKCTETDRTTQNSVKRGDNFRTGNRSRRCKTLFMTQKESLHFWHVFQCSNASLKMGGILRLKLSCSRIPQQIWTPSRLPNLKTSRIQPTEEMSRVQAIKIIMLAVSTHTSRDLRERGPAAKLRCENGANIHGISLSRIKFSE